MRKSKKLLLWLLAIICLSVAVPVALLFLVDTSLYRAQIERHVSTAFGREVVLEGPVSLEPSLTPRFAVKGLKIANPEWASRPSLLTVDKFKVRVNLLSLLRSDLEIVSLEFYGVDLLLEEASDGANNFTFGGSSEPTALPAIQRISLYDATLAYAAPEGPVWRLNMNQVTARKVLGQPVELEARTAINTIPVKLSLHGKPPDDSDPHGPWLFTLLGEAGNLSLRVKGNVADPTDWSQGEFRLELKGRHLDELEALSGYPLPEAEPYKLGANLRFKLDEYVTLSDLSSQLGSSDINGKLHWDMSSPRSKFKVRLDSQQLIASEIGLSDPLPREAGQDNMNFLERSLDFGELGAIDIDIEARIKRLDGLVEPLQDIVVSAHTDRQHFRLTAIKATVSGTEIEASASLPWGEGLATLAPETVSLNTLLQHTELDIRAQAPDARYRVATTLLGRPLDLTFATAEAAARPSTGFMISAEATLNDKPVTINLQGEPLAELLQQPTGPWQELALKMRGDDIHLDATGSVARPFQGAGFDIRYDLNGDELYQVLPLRGSYSFTGRYADHADRHVFDNLKLTIGKSNIGGSVVVNQGGSRTKLTANLDSEQIHLDEILPIDAGDPTAASDWDQPLQLDGLGTVDLDAEVRVRRLEGLAKPIGDILFDAHTKEQSLILAPVQGTLAGIHLDARVQLPWGERLATLAKEGISAQQLIRYTDIALNAQALEGKLSYRNANLGHPFVLELTKLKASARPKEELQIDAKTLLNDIPIQINLRAKPLAELLQRPTGPWKDLVMEAQGDDIRLRATGSVEQPLEISGFDIQYKLEGTEIDTLLPLFDLVLPLEGPYSLIGRFADLPDRLVFDELELTSGNSDIGGNISVYQGKHRPRVEANLQSEQIYLSELLPVSDTTAQPDTDRRVIPDYNLPIEHMREIDGELRFEGKRLRTAVGDLGDIRIDATLKDGVFRIDPFRVRGWAGALIESDVRIDAAQDPPVIALQGIARQLNYGALLEQAGFFETVEGKLDITLRLSGSGRTRREFLSDANGQLIVVGKEGRFGSRTLDLWGSDLVTTMLSNEWRREDVTELNCAVARIRIEDGIASSDDLIIDTQRITIAASGTVDLESEELNLMFAPRPKRASLVSLTNPAHVTGTLAAPEVTATVLPLNRMAAAGSGLLAGLINPALLIFTFTQMGSGEVNPCEAAIEQAMAMKAKSKETDSLPGTTSTR